MRLKWEMLEEQGGVAEKVDARSDDKTISVRQARVSTEPSGANHAGENKYP